MIRPCLCCFIYHTQLIHVYKNSLRFQVYGHQKEFLPYFHLSYKVKTGNTLPEELNAKDERPVLFGIEVWVFNFILNSSIGVLPEIAEIEVMFKLIIARLPIL